MSWSQACAQAQAIGVEHAREQPVVTWWQALDLQTHLIGWQDRADIYIYEYTGVHVVHRSSLGPLAGRPTPPYCIHRGARKRRCGSNPAHRLGQASVQLRDHILHRPNCAWPLDCCAFLSVQPVLLHTPSGWCSGTEGQGQLHRWQYEIVSDISSCTRTQEVQAAWSWRCRPEFQS